MILSDAPYSVTNFGAVDEQTLAFYPGPALVLDRQGHVLAVNPRAESLVEAIEDDLLPSLPLLLLPGPQPRQPVVESLPVVGGGQVFMELIPVPLNNDLVLLLGRDVTLERNLRAALVESRQRYKDLVEISSDFAWETGPDGCFAFVSPKGALGYASEDLVGRRPEALLLHQGPISGGSVFAADQALVDVEVWMRDAHGHEACVLTSARPLVDETETWQGARGICRNVTEQRQRDAALLRANNRERLLTYVVRTLRDELDPADMLRAAADATGRALHATGCQIFRRSSDNSSLILAAQFGQCGDHQGVIDRLLSQDQAEDKLPGWHVLASATRYRNATNGAICLWRAGERAAWGDDERLLIEDVANQVGLANEQITNHERILLLSRTDALTALFNRRAFFEEVGRRHQRLAKGTHAAALIYCDLDNFKWVNDVHGHQVGDEALLKLREILAHHTRPTDLLARLGGDEFAIWLDGADEDIVSDRCRIILQASKELAAFSGSPDRPLHLSLGAAVFHPQSGEALDELLARADGAMYQVKRDGKGAWRLASPYAKGDA